MDENESPIAVTVLREFLSHTLNYKGTVSKIPDEEKYEVSVYQWFEHKGRDGLPEKPLWERISGPLILDNYFEAERLAESNMRLLSGELRDGNVSTKMDDWLKEYSGDAEAEFLDPRNYTSYFFTESAERVEESEKTISALKIAVVHDFYIVEANDEWFLGMLESEGKIKCWSSFRSFEGALDALNAAL